MKHVYIFRHGETDWNTQKRAQGWIDIPLNDNGRSQAEKLASLLSPVGLEIIYSSPLSRALETARIVAKSANINVVVNEGLKEINLGIFSGKIIRVTDNPDEKKMDMSQDEIVVPSQLINNSDFVPLGGESMSQLDARAWNVLTEILKVTDCDKIGISTHSGLARSILRRFLPDCSFPNAEFFKLDWCDGKLVLNDVPSWFTDYRRSLATCEK